MYAEDNDDEPYRSKYISIKDLMERAQKEETSQLELLAMSGDAYGQGEIKAFRYIKEDDI